MESPDLMLPWARTAYAAALRANAKKQVAGQAQAARKIAQTEAKQALRDATSVTPAKKRAAQQSPSTKSASKRAPKKKLTRLAQPVKRGKRAR